MSIRKQVVFGTLDSDLLRVADRQENFSAYVKRLIQKDSIKEQDEIIVAQNQHKPKIYKGKLE